MARRIKNTIIMESGRTKLYMQYTRRIQEIHHMWWRLIACGTQRYPALTQLGQYACFSSAA